MQPEIAGDFKQEVAEKKNARAEAVDGLTEIELVQHLLLGETNVDAV